MSKKKLSAVAEEKLRNEIKAEFAESIKTNGLSGAVFGAGFPTAGYGFGGPGTQEVSQPSQIFNDLRWYFVSNFRQMLSQAYCELGLVQTIVDVPVDDAFRGGIEVTSKELTGEQLNELQDIVEREADLSHLAQAFKWNRLFGGAGTLILTDQDPATPLDIGAINANTPLEFRAVDMWELYYDMQNTGGFDGALQDERFDYFSYYGTKVHKSRVMKLRGIPAPSFLRPRLRGWGLSVVEGMVRSVNQYLEGVNLIYELIDEAKIDVYGIKNLTNTLMAPQGTAKVAERIQLANRIKDYQHAIVMDAEDTYEQKTLTFSGLAEVMEQVRMQVASDLRMPLTKLFGISAAGFNSGEDDIEVYNGMLEGTIRKKAKIFILDILELRCQKLFGFVPADLAIEFEPLRVLSKEQVEKIKDMQTKRVLEAFTGGLISLEEARDAMNKSDALGIPLEEAALPEGADEIQNIPGNEGAEGQADASAAKESDASQSITTPAPGAKAEPPTKDLPSTKKGRHAVTPTTGDAPKDYDEAKRRGTLPGAQQKDKKKDK